MFPLKGSKVDYCQQMSHREEAGMDRQRDFLRIT